MNRKIAPAKCRKFIAALIESGGNVSKAAAAVHVSRNAIYQLKRKDKRFSAEWDNAVEVGTDALESEARRRAMDGVDEPVFYKGEPVGAIRRYSDTLLIFLLKGNRPEKYREQIGLNPNLPDGKSGKVVFEMIIDGKKEDFVQGGSDSGKVPSK